MTPSTLPGVARARPLQLSRSARWMRLAVMGTAAGYLIFGRTFAYMGIPGLYPGEVLILATATGRYSWIRTYLSAARLKPALALTVLLFLLWGCVEALRGYVSGYPILDIIEGLPAHYYPLLLFAGMSVGNLLQQGALKRYYSWLTVASGLSAIAFTLSSNQGIVPTLPWGPDVAILSGAAIPPFCLLVYIALSKRISPSFFIVCAPAAVAILIGGRGSMLGLVCGILTLLPRRRKFIGSIALPAIAALVTLSLFSQILPDLGGRTGRVTPTSVFARMIAAFNEDSAVGFDQGNEENESTLEFDAGTAEWRRHLWADSIASLTSNSDWAFGHGYGPVLGDILPGEVGSGYTHDLRTPHNFAIYLLAYTGLVGAALYLALLIAIAFELYRCPPSFAKDATIAVGVAVIAIALSGNLLETPFGAVPVYALIGMLLTESQRATAADRVLNRSNGIHAVPNMSVTRNLEPARQIGRP